MQPLSQRVIDQTFCAFDECRAKFTASDRGLTCSRCRLASYCNAQCQKSDWSIHRRACKGLGQNRQQQRIDTPLEDRRPPIVLDCRQYWELITPVVRVAARSAMQLGHPDSLAQDSWLHLVLTYHVPPIERWSKSGDKPVGDEHTLFTLSELTPRPDSILDEKEFEGISAAEKKKKCGELIEGRSDHSVVFLIVHATLPNNSCGGSGATYPIYLTIPHSVGGLLPFSERHLNPSFKLLFPMTVTSAPKDKEESGRRLLLLQYLDLAMSEPLQVLRDIPFSPNEGWLTMWANVRKIMRSARNGDGSQVVLYHSLLQ